MQNKNNNLKKNIYYIIDIYIYIYMWSRGPKSYNWVLGFGQEREKYESEEEYLLG